MRGERASGSKLSILKMRNRNAGTGRDRTKPYMLSVLQTQCSLLCSGCLPLYSSARNIEHGFSRVRAFSLFHGISFPCLEGSGRTLPACDKGQVCRQLLLPHLLLPRIQFSLLTDVKKLLARRHLTTSLSSQVKCICFYRNLIGRVLPLTLA